MIRSIRADDTDKKSSRSWEMEIILCNIGSASNSDIYLTGEGNPRRAGIRHRQRGSLQYLALMNELFSA